MSYVGALHPFEVQMTTRMAGFLEKVTALCILILAWLHYGGPTGTISSLWIRSSAILGLSIDLEASAYE